MKDRHHPYFFNRFGSEVESMFKLDKDTNLPPEDAELIADIAEYLTNQADAREVMKYIAELLDLRGFEYLQIASLHIKNKVLPFLERYSRWAKELATGNPDPFYQHSGNPVISSQHVKVTRDDYLNLKSNVASLDYLLQKFAQGKQAEPLRTLTL